MPQASNRTIQYAVWAAVVLLIFVVGALLGSRIFYGVLVPLIPAVEQLSMFVILGFAFVAGLAAFFAPCPFAVFPAYIAYYLNAQDNSLSENQTSRAIRVASFVSLGIFSFYLLFGVAVALFGTALGAYVPSLRFVVAPVFLILGLILLTKGSISTTKLDALADKVAKRAQGGKHFMNMYFYGIVYGIAAAACHLPILLALSLYPILAGQFLTGVMAFVAYAFGTSLVLVTLTILAGKGQKFLISNVGLYGERIKKVSGVILILTALYLFGLIPIFGMSGMSM